MSEDSTSRYDNTTLSLYTNESCKKTFDMDFNKQFIFFQEADRIDMKFFRYGGVNVTYFLPKSFYQMHPPIDPITANRLSLPSVCYSIGIAISI